MADPWKAEQDRQSQELADILKKQIDDYGLRLKAANRQPSLNAVVSALVTLSGAMLASIEDRRIRKELRRVMERGLSRAVAIHEGRAGRAEIIVAGRRADA